MNGIRFTEHYFAKTGEALPPADESLLVEYIVGSNATFARGRRQGLEVCLPVSFNLAPIRGLAEVMPYAQWGFPKVPEKLLKGMLEQSRQVCAERPTEALFYLSFGDVKGVAIDKIAYRDGWYAVMPKQDALDQRVCADAFPGVIIELHSHHQMEAEFSPGDDADEQWFRIYVVIGTIFDRPTIRARVGLYGHFMEYPASEFFELPAEIADCTR